MKLANKVRAQLIADLRQVAAAYYNGQLPPAHMEYGICFAMRLLGVSGWPLIQVLGSGELNMLQTSSYLAPRGTCWPQRAMFCLVLAEYLEQDGAL